MNSVAVRNVLNTKTLHHHQQKQTIKKNTTSSILEREPFLVSTLPILQVFRNRTSEGI